MYTRATCDLYNGLCFSFSLLSLLAIARRDVVTRSGGEETRDSARACMRPDYRGRSSAASRAAKRRTEQHATKTIAITD